MASISRDAYVEQQISEALAILIRMDGPDADFAASFRLIHLHQVGRLDAVRSDSTAHLPTLLKSAAVDLVSAEAIASIIASWRASLGRCEGQRPFEALYSLIPSPVKNKVLATLPEWLKDGWQQQPQAGSDVEGWAHVS